MFKKKEKVVAENYPQAPMPKAPEPTEVQELKDLPEDAPESQGESESELTEEQVRGFFEDITTVLSDFDRRLKRVEHNLRLDFND